MFSPVFYGFGQSFDTCIIDYQFLFEEPLRVEEVEAGQALYLTDEYIRFAQGQGAAQASVTNPFSAPAPSQAHPFARHELYYYRYLRPASRAELKSPAAEPGGLEVVLTDSNVYALELMIQPTVFFRFRGPETPEPIQPASFQAGKYIFSPGLLPLQLSGDLRGPFWVREKTADYWALEFGDQFLIYFPSLFHTEAIFEMETQQHVLAEKSRRASELLGQSLHLPDKPLAERWEILDVALSPSGCELGIRPMDPSLGETVSYVELSPESTFLVYDTQCLNQHLRELAEAQRKQQEIEQTYLQRLATGELPIELIEQDPAVKTLLHSRFTLARGPFQQVGWYIHIDQTPEKLLNESLIKLNLSEEGELYVQSLLSLPEAFGHTHFRVQVGERSWESPVVPQYEHRNISQDLGDWVQEQIHFSRENLSELIEGLVQSGEQEVRLTFFNKQGQQKEVLLPPVHLKAWRETYVLYLYLKYGRQFRGGR
ncbi:MAG: hypothetical protein D6730_21440 [Bacteroidetes bacterium]|nr:MAG: hypothetical protein D6730_21440 [Bacteroidota bacterium]